MRKVVITGMGVVSPFGAGVDTLMERLDAGDSAVASTVCGEGAGALVLEAEELALARGPKIQGSIKCV